MVQVLLYGRDLPELLADVVHRAKCMVSEFSLRLQTASIQHQDDDSEVFEDGTWTYVKGAMQTIDREFGYGLDFILHHEVDCKNRYPY